MACTYFEKCPECGHELMSHIEILSNQEAACNCAGCRCQRRPPRFYIYDKDPEVVKDALTYDHWLVSGPSHLNAEEIVGQIVDGLNLLNERDNRQANRFAAVVTVVGA